MGNHTAGRLIADYAAMLVQTRGPDQSALDVLDAAVAKAKANPGFSPDAEFESQDPNDPTSTHPEFIMDTDPHPSSPLGMLMLEAFAPNGTADVERYRPMLEGTPDGEEDEAEETACERFWEEVKDPFRARYGLC